MPTAPVADLVQNAVSFNVRMVFFLSHDGGSSP